MSENDSLYNSKVKPQTTKEVERVIPQDEITVCSVNPSEYSRFELICVTWFIVFLLQMSTIFSNTDNLQSHFLFDLEVV